MPAPFNLIGIDHVVLRAADPVALERFYMDVLGCTFEKRQGTLAQLRAGQALIDIVPADETGPAEGRSSTGGANLDHLCLRVAPFDAIRRRHDGTSVEVSITANPVMGPTGRVVAVAKTIRDISARKAAESEIFLEQAGAISAVGGFRIDLAPVPDHVRPQSRRRRHQI